MDEISKVVVIGAGQMGQQIAMQSALYGFSTNLYDIDEKSLQTVDNQLKKVLANSVRKSKLTDQGVTDAFERLHYKDDLADAVAEADLVIEAIVEDVAIKRELFGQLEELAPVRTIFATNSSTIVSSKLATATKRPEKVVNMHFFNPPLVMDLVEIVRNEQTSDGTVHLVKSFCQSINRKGVVLDKEIFGFIANRILMSITKEALYLYEGGYASFGDIDFIVKKALGHPLGPFELMDLSGLDVAYAVSELQYEETGDELDKPAQSVIDKVKAGYLGRKTGQGWYDYKK